MKTKIKIGAKVRAYATTVKKEYTPFFEGEGVIKSKAPRNDESAPVNYLVEFDDEPGKLYHYPAKRLQAI